MCTPKILNETEGAVASSNARRCRRCEEATLSYQQAATFAEHQGIKLTKHPDAEYILQCGMWTYNIYPRDLMIIGLNESPPLKVPPRWALIDVVNAVLAALVPDP